MKLRLIYDKFYLHFIVDIFFYRIIDIWDHDSFAIRWRYISF